jgi:hypothetical protein
MAYIVVHYMGDLFMRRKFFGWAAVFTVIALLASVFSVVTPHRAEAANPNDFNPGYIISDQAFFNAGAMNASGIQSFLNSKGGNCASGSTCLSNYKQATNSIGATANCKAYSGSGSESAANIIAKVSAACGINPQVLLVMLQKEQGLVTATSPSALKYKIAMGYACPDTAACDQRYYGFHNQVYSAASQFKQYTRLPNRQYKIGNVAIQYNPNAACGSSVVRIQNQATANLYNYTPYQPNAAAMANLGGSGDSCSAYGNRNFWRYFSDWFGSPTGKVNPVSNLDSVSASPGLIRVTGWAFDPDTKDSIDVHVYVDGTGTPHRANGHRPDVAAVHGDVGNAHGFDISVPVTSSGNKKVCVYAINHGPGTNGPIGNCVDVAARGGAPVGSLDVVTVGAETISTAGWTLDPDTAASIPVHVYVDDKGASFTADKSRADVAAAFQGYGAAHGFATTVTATPGRHTVCAYGIDTAGSGNNTQLGCKTVTVPAKAGASKSRTPIGSLNSVTVGPGSITASGWSIDPDTAGSISVHVYVGKVGVSTPANQTRNDVAAAYPGYGAAHGYSTTVEAPAGRHEVCAFGIDSAGGHNAALGCTIVTVPDPNPFGSFGALSVSDGTITASGWALDPNSSAPIDVHVYVDNVGAAFTSNSIRNDVAKVYPWYGNDVGYTARVQAGKGQHTICVYAINVGAGTVNTNLGGCKVVTVP